MAVMAFSNSPFRTRFAIFLADFPGDVKLFSAGDAGSVLAGSPQVTAVLILVPLPVVLLGALSHLPSGTVYLTNLS
jgi:hypothetical protein